MLIKHGCCAVIADFVSFYFGYKHYIHYIENKDKRFQIFVANRVSAILDQSTAAQWRYVESTLNPADKASRGMTVDELLISECWKQGPPFLKKPEQF